MTDPQRERAEAEALRFLTSDIWCDADGDDALAALLADLLLEFAREAREDEAKWWHMQRGHHGRNWCCERVESLQQPAKKGTQP